MVIGSHNPPDVCTRSPPFEEERENILDNGIKDEKVIKVLKGCFEVDPDKRISIGEILQTLDFVGIIKNPKKNEDKEEKK